MRRLAGSQTFSPDRRQTASRTRQRHQNTGQQSKTSSGTGIGFTPTEPEVISLMPVSHQDGIDHILFQPFESPFAGRLALPQPVDLEPGRIDLLL
jgi:hypothetical protein